MIGEHRFANAPMKKSKWVPRMRILGQRALSHAMGTANATPLSDTCVAILEDMKDAVDEDDTEWFHFATADNLPQLETFLSPPVPGGSLTKLYISDWTAFSTVESLSLPFSSIRDITLVIDPAEYGNLEFASALTSLSIQFNYYLQTTLGPVTLTKQSCWNLPAMVHINLKCECVPPRIRAPLLTSFIHSRGGLTPMTMSSLMTGSPLLEEVQWGAPIVSETCIGRVKKYDKLPEAGNMKWWSLSPWLDDLFLSHSTLRLFSDSSSSSFSSASAKSSSSVVSTLPRVWPNLRDFRCEPSLPVPHRFLRVALTSCKLTTLLLNLMNEDLEKNTQAIQTIMMNNASCLQSLTIRYPAIRASQLSTTTTSIINVEEKKRSEDDDVMVMKELHTFKVETMPIPLSFTRGHHRVHLQFPKLKEVAPLPPPTFCEMFASSLGGV